MVSNLSLPPYKNIFRKTAPIQIVSFAQFVAAHLDKLTFQKAIEKKVTLHEACKSAYTSADLWGPREILAAIPGISVSEMPRHGLDTACCGSGAITWFPKEFNRIRDERLQEAEETGAELLIGVCHFCHETFAGEENRYSYNIYNYVNLLAEALGIKREDKFKKYLQVKDMQKIKEDCSVYRSELPFSNTEVEAAIKKAFL